MKKKILSTVLVLALVLSMVPALGIVAAAEDTASGFVEAFQNLMKSIFGYVNFEHFSMASFVKTIVNQVIDIIKTIR